MEARPRPARARARPLVGALAAAGSLALLAACGHPRRVAIPPSPAQAGGDFSVELEFGNGVWIEVGQPSHVTVFRVRSGAGAVVLWPYQGGDKRIPAGRTRIEPWTLDEQHAYEDRAWLAFGEGRVTVRQFLLVVASERPLLSAPYFGDPLLMEEKLDDAYYGERSLVEGILDLVVEDRDGEWGWACLGEDSGVAMPTPPGSWYRRWGAWSRADRLRDERACPARAGG